MIVKCINNYKCSKSLNEGELYTISLKRQRSYNLILVGKSGMFGIERFEKLNGDYITFSEGIINYHHRLKYSDIDYSTIKYCRLKDNSTLKTLDKNKFYYINTLQRYMGDLYVHLLKSSEYIIPYKWDNFVFYTKDDYISLMRYKKIKELKTKIT